MNTDNEMVEKFKQNTVIDGNCWIWKGRCNRNGYPIASKEYGSREKNNRQVISYNVRKFMFEAAGSVNNTRWIQNTCGNTLCINPDHLVNYSDDVRFWNYVEKKSNGCWNWIGFTNDKGYGKMTFDGGQDSMSVHRYSYEKFHNESVPPGLFVLHNCNNPSCVNPDHLRVGTHNDNMEDMARTDVLKGENNPKALLNKEQVLEIKQLIKERMVTYRKIGERYGVSRQAIKDIASGRTWKWVE